MGDIGLTGVTGEAIFFFVLLVYPTVVGDVVALRKAGGGMVEAAM